VLPQQEQQQDAMGSVPEPKIQKYTRYLALSLYLARGTFK